MVNKSQVYTKTGVIPSKVAASKVYEYIKMVETQGIPRIKAYAKCIDPEIYSMTPSQIAHRLDYFQNSYKGYAEIKEMVLQEEKDWMLRRNSSLQNKALDLLSNLLDKANEIATDPEADAKELNTAINTLKSVLPAFQAVGSRTSQDTDQRDKKSRAAGYIN
jgi:hypothetical protein